MKHKKELSLSVACFLLAFLCSMIWRNTREENLAGQISPHILRFHVLANSNSVQDQQLKTDVKGLLLDLLSRSDADSKEALCQYVLDNQEPLEQAAEDYMQSLGFPYEAGIAVTNTYFPTKAYGDMVLPCGRYDAVEVTLGDGRGRNWWCVLYPRLCFVDATHAIVPDDSRLQLQNLLTPDQYRALWDNRNLKINIRFRFWESLKDTLSTQ